jgi:hypothetical protein
VAFRIDEFIDVWFFETQRVQKVLSRLTDQTLAIKNPEGRQLMGEIAWKLVQNPLQMLAKTEIGNFYPEVEKSFPSTIRRLREQHLDVVRAVRQQIFKQWENTPLKEVDSVSKVRTREQILVLLFSKQVEIRLQLMKLMRKEGIELPDLNPVPPELTI